MRLRIVLIVLTALTSQVAAQDQAKIPTPAEVQDLLKKEPINEENWPAWKKRLTAWFDDTSRSTDAAYLEASKFAGALAGPKGELPPRFDNDHLTWYFLGGYHLDRNPVKPDDFVRAEQAYRRTIAIDPRFPRGHRNLAMALAYQVKPPEPGFSKRPREPKLDEAELELRIAEDLDPKLPLDTQKGIVAQRRGDFSRAIGHFETALRTDTQNVGLATQVALCALSDDKERKPAARIEPLTKRFPRDGVLATLFAFALEREKRQDEARDEIQRARSLGFEPEKLWPEEVAKIEGGYGIVDQFLTVMMWFAIVYGCIMLVMAIAGVILASMTRGTGALDLLKQQDPAHLVQQGHIARGSGESLLARLYGFALVIGLILFYAAIPFIIAGLLGATALLLYLIFQMGSVPIKLVVVIFIVGGLSAWAVFKSIFTRPATGGFGLLKTREQCAALHQLLSEVAQKVDTDPVNEVFLAPGAGIGVHQEGRGPFGMFGISKRVLTLGFCTLRFLTVGELKAILAHEYAHFSHSDTFYSRFIYQVHMSIEEALNGMISAGGIISYVNPFYWFLWLYYKSYSLLAAGYSRSREFLADRMAATLYGSVQFKTALEKVSTDGALFEVTIYEHISTLLREQKAFVNMYEAFAKMREEGIPVEERNKFYQDLLGEKGSLFASHPTFAERIEAIQMLPAATEPDNRSALELFEQPGAIEEELTKFLTDYMAYLAHLQAQAAQQQG